MVEMEVMETKVMKLDKRTTMWMNGIGCIKCLDPKNYPDHPRYGWYHGYRTINGKSVCVCNKCGDIQPASMRTWQFFKLIKERDEKHGA